MPEPGLIVHYVGWPDPEGPPVCQPAIVCTPPWADHAANLRVIHNTIALDGDSVHRAPHAQWDGELHPGSWHELGHPYVPQPVGGDGDG